MNFTLPRSRRWLGVGGSPRQFCLRFLLTSVFCLLTSGIVCAQSNSIAPGSDGATTDKKPFAFTPPKPKGDGESDWKNGGNTDWNTAGNWTAVSGSAPPAAGDVAWFKTAFNAGQPNLSASTSIAGFYFKGTGTSGYDITSSSAAIKFTLTATGTTIGTELGDTTAVAIGAENNTGTNTISAPIVLAPSSGTTSTFAQAGGGTLTISGAISGSGIALTFIRSNTVGLANFQLNGANSYSGATTVQDNTSVTFGGSNSSAGITTVNGTAILGTGTNGGLASGLLTLGGATIKASDNTPRTLTNLLSLGTSNITFGASSTGALTFSGNVTLTGTSTWTTTSATTFNGAISGGANGITKVGGAIMTFGGGTNNTYTGTTTVNVGELDLNKTGATAIAGNISIGDGTGTDTVKLLQSNQIADTSDITLNAAATPTFDLNNNSETIDGLNSSNTAASVKLGTGTLTVGANNETSATFAGVISGTGGNLIKTGTGTETLSGANTYTGTTTINNGKLNAAANGALGSTSSIMVNSGGTLVLSNSAATDRINNAAGITLAGGTIQRQGPGTVSEGTGASTTTGGATHTGTSTVGMGALTLTSNSTLDFGSGSGGVGTMTFASFAPGGNVLNIINYINTTASFPLVSGVDATDDRLIFASDQAANLADFSFGGTSALEIALGGGFFEIVPVPEPSTWVAAALALGVIAFTQRKRFARNRRSVRRW